MSELNTAAASPANKNLITGTVRRVNTYFADPKAINRIPGWNPRFDFGDIEGLSKSIRAIGVQQPLTVRRAGDGFELLDGDRRLAAIELALKDGHDFSMGVPVIIVDKATSERDALLRMFIANDGKKFLPLEEAYAYKKMQDAGMTLAEIETATGRSDNSIVGALALLQADPVLQEAIKNGQISGGDAKAIAVNARGDKELQKALVSEAKSAGKDKKKRAVLKVKIDEARREKAKKRGAVLKARALSNAELSDLGTSMVKSLSVKLATAKLELHGQKEIEGWIGNDKKLIAAYTFGALMALKAATGIKVALDYPD